MSTQAAIKRGTGRRTPCTRSAEGRRGARTSSPSISSLFTSTRRRKRSWPCIRYRPIVCETVRPPVPLPACARGSGWSCGPRRGGRQRRGAERRRAVRAGQGAPGSSAGQAASALRAQRTRTAARRGRTRWALVRSRAPKQEHHRRAHRARPLAARDGGTALAREAAVCGGCKAWGGEGARTITKCACEASGTRSSHCGLPRHVGKLKQPPAVPSSSDHDPSIVERCHSSSGSTLQTYLTRRQVAGAHGRRRVFRRARAARR